MKSAIYAGPGRPIVVEERPIPVPSAGQALIRIHRCGVCGSDIAMTSGGDFDYPHGFSLGHEYSGEVVDIGPGCEILRRGDRVTALPLSSCGKCAACLADTPIHCPQFTMMAGGFSEFTLIDERMAFKLPQSLSYADGALVEPLAAALRGVRKLEILAGARVAVLGAGAIGISAAFWVRRMGAGSVAVVARSRRGEDLAFTVGADVFLTSEELQRLNEALGGAPDIVIEGAGAPSMVQCAIELARPAGTILSLGGCHVSDRIVPAMAMAKEVRLLFSVAYGTQDFRLAVDALEGGDVSPRAMIGDTIPLAALPERLEAMRAGSHAAKIMVDPQAQ